MKSYDRKPVRLNELSEPLGHCSGADTGAETVLEDQVRRSDRLRAASELGEDPARSLIDRDHSPTPARLGRRQLRLATNGDEALADRDVP